MMEPTKVAAINLKENVIKQILGVLVTEQRSIAHSDSDSTEESDMEMYSGIALNNRIITRIPNFVKITVPSYCDKTFQSHFRLERSTVEQLINTVNAQGFQTLYLPGKKQIETRDAVLMTVWYLSNSESFRQISDRFNVSFSTAHKTIMKVINIFIKMRKSYIIWPNDYRKRSIAEVFERKKGFKNCIGAIDGCHIVINRPLKNEDSYVNRKGFHSVLLQGVVDYSGKFIDVYCEEPGSVHDARMLRKSKLYLKAEYPDYFGQYYILGDSAYPNLRWLLVPFKDTGNLTENQKYFNFKHSSARIVVEHTYGMLKGRFRRLIHLTNLDIKTCVKIVMACCVLHNICEQDRTEITPVAVENIDDHNNEQFDGINNIRETIFRYIINSR